jgi:hypothetical protein
MDSGAARGGEIRSHDDAAFFGGDAGLFAAAVEKLIWPD